MRRYPKALIWILIAGAMLSVALGLVIEPRSPKSTFYHLPTRLWEFAFGILAYLLSRRFDERIAALRGWGSMPVALAIAAIILSAVIYPEGAAFPGPQSLIACGATALVLALTGPLTGHPALAWMRLASVVYIGRISYGFYLWHWPPLAIYYLALGKAAQPLTATGLMLLAFLGAVVSFHLVEEPIRRKRRLPSSKVLLRFVGASSLLTACVALTGVLSNGLIQRYPTELQPFLAAPAELGIRRCGKVFALLNPSAQSCPLSQVGETGAGAILILGDSHADVLKEMIVASGQAAGRDVYLTTRNCSLGQYGSFPFCSASVLQSVISEARAQDVTEVIAISSWLVDLFDAASMSTDIKALTDAVSSFG